MPRMSFGRTLRLFLIGKFTHSLKVESAGTRCMRCNKSRNCISGVSMLLSTHMLYVWRSSSPGPKDILSYSRIIRNSKNQHRVSMGKLSELNQMLKARPQEGPKDCFGGEHRTQAIKISHPFTTLDCNAMFALRMLDSNN